MFPLVTHHPLCCSTAHPHENSYPQRAPRHQDPEHFLLHDPVCIQQWDQEGTVIPSLQMTKQRPREVM